VRLEEHFKDSYDKEIWGIQTNNANTGSAEENSRRANGELTIRVKDQSGEETFFKVKTWTKMGKIFGAYASRKGVDADSLTFLLDGNKIYSYHTPSTLELEDQDQIDAILEQCGC